MVMVVAKRYPIIGIKITCKDWGGYKSRKECKKRVFHGDKKKESDNYNPTALLYSITDADT